MIVSLLWTAAGVLVLVLLNGLYVAGEFALIGSRRSRLEALARGGHTAAGKVLALTSDMKALDRAIATLQVGITVASLGLGMYGEHAVAARLQPLLAGFGPASWAASHAFASTLTMIVLTLLHVTLGEVVPKSIALQNPVRAALALATPLRWTELAARPLVALLAGLSRVILRLLGVKSERARSGLTVDDIEAIVEESAAGGALQPQQARLLANLLDFEDLPLRKVMVPRNLVTGLPVTAGWEEVLATVRESEHSRFPLYEEDLDHIIGYLHVKDLMPLLEKGEPLDLRQVSRPIPFLPETASCAALLRRQRRLHTHLAVVLDEHGGTAGIVSLEDLVEEIFGEVQDEFDAEEMPIRVLGESAALVRGNCRLDEINDALGLRLEDEDVDTAAGLVMKALGRIARPGDVVRVRGVVLTVDAVERLSVSRVRLSWTPGA